MERRIIKKLENVRGSGWGSRSDRKYQRKQFRQAISNRMVKQGLKDYEEEVDEKFCGDV